MMRMALVYRIRHIKQLKQLPQPIPKADIYIGTLGKAIGTSGAFVAGSHALIDYLINFARSYIYTTATPPALAKATQTAVQVAPR